jgi:hypothetical protein
MPHKIDARFDHGKEMTRTGSITMRLPPSVEANSTVKSRGSLHCSFTQFLCSILKHVIVRRLTAISDLTI